MAASGERRGLAGHSRASAGWPRVALLAWADAYLCAAALVVAESLLVAARAWRELAGPFELVRIAIGLIPPALALALPVSLLGAVAIAALVSRSRRAGRMTMGALAGALGLFAAVGSSGGRLLAGARRPPFVLVVVLAAVALGWFGLRWIGRGVDRAAQSGRRGTAVVIACVVLLLGCLGWVNANILPRLYPAFHGTLTLAAFAAVAAVALTWQPWRSSDDGGGAPWRAGRHVRRMGSALAMGLVAIALTPWSAKRFATQDNLRLIFLERSPMLAHVVELTARLAPPPRLDEPLDDRTADSAPRQVDLSGRDFLLVTVDALRADHVGAWGYARPTTPRIDELARGAVVFDQAYSPTPHTSYAIASMLTGKHLRPLMQQGLGADSEPIARTLRRYGYRTAAFYPPAVFYIDPDRFVSFSESGLGFEYRKVEFASPALRVRQLQEYLDRHDPATPLFVWVHLFEPHEPYVRHPGRDFGDQAIDRYDSEIAEADAGVGEIVATMRRARPSTLVIFAADHGEEFGDHGGRYHGTTVYDEQVRVPLFFQAPGLLEPRRVPEPVSLVDLVPTLLKGLGIALSPSLHGRDLGPLLVGQAQEDRFAMAETDEFTLLARDRWRLVCARRAGACRLFDTSRDPAQQQDRAAENPAEVQRLKRLLGGFLTSLGRYEALDESTESAATHWPSALRRALAGEGDAAVDAATLLDDADVAVRRKAAEALFELRRAEVSAQLQRTLRRDEDETVRRWCALALTRLGQGAPLTLDMVADGPPEWRRLAALALAEAGDDRGEGVLVAWWNEAFPKGSDAAEPAAGLTFERAKDLIAAFAKLRSKKAVPGLLRALRSVRLRMRIAEALGAIGEDVARPALVDVLRTERYIDARLAIVRALVSLGASGELRDPLVWLLGVPDPLPGGLGFALEADILDLVGGPRKRLLARLRDYANSGVAIGVAIPEGDRAIEGFRVIVRAQSTDGETGLVRFGLPARAAGWAGGSRSSVPSQVPPLDPERSVSLSIEPSASWIEVHATMPATDEAALEAGKYAEFAVYATQGVRIDAFAVVPLSADLPPPAPKPWHGGQGGPSGAGAH